MVSKKPVAPPKNSSSQKYKKNSDLDKKKKRKPRSEFTQYDLKDMEQFSLCDAIRYAISTPCAVAVLIPSQVHQSL